MSCENFVGLLDLIVGYCLKKYCVEFDDRCVLVYFGIGLWLKYIL